MEYVNAVTSINGINVNVLTESTELSCMFNSSDVLLQSYFYIFISMQMVAFDTEGDVEMEINGRENFISSIGNYNYITEIY